MASLKPEEPHEHQLVRNSTGGQNCFLCGLSDLEIATGVRAIKPKENIKNFGLLKQEPVWNRLTTNKRLNKKHTEEKDGGLDQWK